MQTAWNLPTAIVVGFVLLPPAAGMTRASAQEASVRDEAAIDSVVDELRRLGLAAARVVGPPDAPTIVAVGRARFEPDGGWKAGLRAVLMASIDAKAAMIACLEGPEVAASSRIAARIASSAQGTTRVRQIESTLDVAIAGVLASVEPRGCWIDEKEGLVEVALESRPERWSTSLDAVPTYDSLSQAATQVARAAAEFAIVPDGARLVRIGRGPDARLAVVGLGTAVVPPGKGTRTATILAGRKSASAIVAYLEGEQIERRDSLEQMLDEVERVDPTDRRAGPITAEVSVTFRRTASSFTKGATPQGAETAEASFEVLGERVLVGATAAPLVSGAD